MKRLLLLSTLGVSPLVLGLQANAASCTLSGTTVTCAGTVTDGFAASSSTGGLRVTVSGDVSNAGGDAIRMRGDGNRVTNTGTIAGTKAIADGGSDGIDGGNSLIVINSGTITATNKAIDAEQKDRLYVSNTGTIYAYDKAIRNQDGNYGSLTNEGLIESETDEGFESGDYAWVLNTGTIRASDDAIQVGENASIFNYGLIESVRRGGDEADPQDGIDIDSGSITNYVGAVIRSDDDAAIDYDESIITSTIANYGLISGTIGVLTDPANTAKQIVHNYGTIEGSAGYSVDLGAGDDELRLYNNSILTGTALLGDGDDLLYFGSAITNLTTGLIDGGAGINTVEFFRLDSTDIFSVSLFSDRMTVSFLSADNDYSLDLINWTSFAFNDGVMSWDQVAALATTAPVPLPAPALMLLTALGGFVVARRRR